MADHSKPAVTAAPNDVQGCANLLGLSALRVLVHALAAFIVFIVFCGSVLRATKFFAQEDLQIPRVTVWMWDLAWWLNGWGIIGVPFLLLVDAAVLAGLQSLPRSTRWLASVWFTVVLFACIVLLGLSNIAVVAPLDILIRPSALDGEFTDNP